MSTFSFKMGRRFRAFSRTASVGVLSVAIILAPLPGNISEARADAKGAQDATSALSKLGSLASAASGLNSVAQGGNSMLKGKQQMQCCKEGCDGAGKEATANKAAQDAGAEAAGKALPKADGTTIPTPPERPQGAPAPMKEVPNIINGNGFSWNFHSVQKAEAVLCSASLNSKAQLVFDLFHPRKVEAAAGCGDAMMAMASGALQMLAGLAGLAAAAMAANNANKSANNSSALGPIGSGQSAAPTAVGPTDLAGGGSSAGIKIDPTLLRDGKGSSTFDQFEKNFGIPREALADALSNGVDPRNLLMNAPKNAFTAAELNQAFTAAKSMSQEQKNAALAGQNELARELASKIGASGEISTAGGAKSSTKSSKDLDELDLLGAEAAKTAEANSAANSELSPELQAALAVKDAEQVREGTNIFQIVHQKYQQRVRMIYGFDAHGKSIGGKGVADANGF